MKNPRVCFVAQMCFGGGIKTMNSRPMIRGGIDTMFNFSQIIRYHFLTLPGNAILYNLLISDS